MGGAGDSGGRKMDTIVLEQQLKKDFTIKNKNKQTRSKEGWRVSLPGGAYLHQCPGNCTCNSLLRSSAFCSLTGRLSRVPW